MKPKKIVVDPYVFTRRVIRHFEKNNWLHDLDFWKYVEKAKPKKSSIAKTKNV